MRVAPLLLFGMVSLAEASSFSPAALQVMADNLSGVAVEITVTGTLAPDAVTMADAGVTSYSEQFTCAAGTGVCGIVPDLRPGAWIHRLSVDVPGSDPQTQARRTVLAAGAASEELNPLRWSVYARTFVVSTTAPDASPGGLRAALDAAATFTAAGGRALVTFARDVFPGAGEPQTIDLSGACEGGGTAICVAGNEVVVDGLDDDALPGAVVWSVGARPVALLRVTGAGNVFRGIVFDGSRVDVPDPETCGAAGSETLQRDTIAFVGSGATGNTVEQCVVLGPTCGDGVSVEQAAADNVIASTRITRAQDRGVKVNDGSATIVRSCIHDNQKGGLLSTLGGDVAADENVVQRNQGGQGQNGLTVLDSCREDNLGCEHTGRSRMTTAGNVVRFSGGRGLSVRDNAEATFTDDYVANNVVKGSVVETTETVPVDADGLERVPAATFRGTAMVCNGSDGNPGVGAETRRDVGHEPPAAGYGDADTPGQNAFTSNRNTSNGANFLLTNVVGPVPATGNQWGHCAGSSCEVLEVRVGDVVPFGANVDLGAGRYLAGSRAGRPVIHRITPERPRAGEVVRVYGENFDAINGNPTRDACDEIALAECSPEGTCPDGPCIDGSCPCSIENPVVQARNVVTMQRPEPPNRIRIRIRDGVVLPDVAPDVVTPTMLAFHMPVDCFAPFLLIVTKYGSGALAPLCAPRPVTTTTSSLPSTSSSSSTSTTTSSTSSTSTTSTSTTTTTTTSSTSTSTSSTLPRVCGLEVPSRADVSRCTGRRLRRRAATLVLRIEHALGEGREPKCGAARRLIKLLKRCDRRASRRAMRGARDR
jgi:hypothetical protein